MTYLYAMQTEFEEILHQTLGVPISHTHEIAACFKPKSLTKNEIFQIGDQFLSQIGFVQSGFIREYFVDEEGKEVTKWIATAPRNIQPHPKKTQPTDFLIFIKQRSKTTGELCRIVSPKLFSRL